MAATGGAESPALMLNADRYEKVEAALWTEPWSFQFFQAVRLLQRILANRAPVGRFVHPGKEIVRFAASPSTAFPASQIQELRWEKSAAPVMVVNFMGLTGPLGVLPLYYSELIRERLRSKDPVLLAFFNLFNHRMVSLFYQAWEKYRFSVAYERGERDRLSSVLLDLIGLGTARLQHRQAVRDDALLFYSGQLALHTRSAVSLRSMLADYFEVPVRVEQFVGAWHSLSSSDRCEFNLGVTFSEQLGVGAVVGDEIWDQQASVRIVLGPLTMAQYVDFLPEGSAYEPLRAITRFFSGDEIDFEVQLILKRDEVPACELDDTPRGQVLPQLGWSTWAKTSPLGHDPGDAVLRI
jgi:type VI secretion system protein ImpH